MKYKCTYFTKLKYKCTYFGIPKFEKGYPAEWANGIRWITSPTAGIFANSSVKHLDFFLCVLRPKKEVTEDGRQIFFFFPRGVDNFHQK